MRRLRSPRTILSLAVPILLIVLLARSLPGFQLDQLPARILAANPWLLLAAFVIYYVGFPIRGYRWALLLRGAGTRLSTRDSTEIVFISWLVNCLVPAKLGDVYRAYLLSMNQTRLDEPDLRHGLHRAGPGPLRDRRPRPRGRLLELPQRLRPYVQFVFGLGVAVVVVLAVAMLTLRNFGRRILVRLPVPAQRRRAVRPVRGGRLRASRPAACRAWGR